MDIAHKICLNTTAHFTSERTERMILNSHNSTPTTKLPKYLTYMFAVLFILMYSIFALLGFVVIYYAKAIWVSILLIILPFIFLFGFFGNCAGAIDDCPCDFEWFLFHSASNQYFFPSKRKSIFSDTLRRNSLCQ